MFLFTLLFCVNLIRQAEEVFTDDFNEFLKNTYGEGVQKSLERIDMGPGMIGSFGGKQRSDDKLNNRPVIFVHGALFTAAFYIPHYDFFISRHYSPQELYATTYDSGFETELLDVPVTCAEFKQIRNFIKAVHEYTKKPVDIIAYSLGTLISRKAILGGKCFDTEEVLGDNLTHMVETFVAVGGVAYGFQNCSKERKACNDISSMRCDSLLLRQLNSQPHRYEGNFTYAIFSFDDEILGSQCCGHQCAQLRNAVFSIGFPNMDHLTISSATKFVQNAFLDHPSADDVRNSFRLFVDGTQILTD